MRKLTQLFGGAIIYLSATCAFAGSLVSDDLYLRESVPGAENGAGFGTLHNPTNDDLVVVAAASTVAVDVELHRHVHRDGQMSMERIDALTIPAGETVELRPGGYHIMFMQLHEPLRVNDSHRLTLQLNSGERVEFNVPVKPLLQ